MARKTCAKADASTPARPESFPAVAVVAGSFLSGAMMSISLITVPVLLETASSSTELARQWVHLYRHGHRLFPFMSATTCLLYSYASFRKRRAGSKRWTVFALAGMITVIMVPFTWVIMSPVNNALFRFEAENKAGPSIARWDKAEELVVKWSGLHVVRSLFPLLGALVGFSGTFS